MVHALDVKELNIAVSDRYDRSEKRIVGIMLARYDLPLTQTIIDSCYLYWHYNTDIRLLRFPDRVTHNRFQSAHIAFSRIAQIDFVMVSRVRNIQLIPVCFHIVVH